MKNSRGVWSLLILLAMAISAPDFSTSENCTSSSSSCNSLIAYVPTASRNISRIAELFSVDVLDIFGANQFSLVENPGSIVISPTTLIRVPVRCGCVGGTRQTSSVVYTVAPGDTLSTISDGYYEHLVTYQEIAAVSNVTNVDLILVGQNLTIPIPCSCHNSSIGSEPAIFLSYPVQSGNTLASIAEEFNATVNELTTLNSLSSSPDLVVGKILDVPIRVCTSSFNANTSDFGLTLPLDSYKITANNCIQCFCGSVSSEVYCAPAPEILGGDCSNLNCTNTNIGIGNFRTQTNASGCIVQLCNYEGYRSDGILSSLNITIDNTCPVALPPPTLSLPPQGSVSSPPLTPTQTGSPPPQVQTTPIAPPPSSSTISNLSRLYGFLGAFISSLFFFTLLQVV